MQITKAIVSTKNFVVSHKVAIAVVTTATVCIALNRKAITQHNEFLKEHGLFDAFYTPEDSY